MRRPTINLLSDINEGLSELNADELLDQVIDDKDWLTNLIEWEFTEGQLILALDSPAN